MISFNPRNDNYVFIILNMAELFNKYGGVDTELSQGIRCSSNWQCATYSNTIINDQIHSH